MFGVKSVALIGRTNVGKSTLFNRLIEETKAITSDLPGTTRDRNEAFVLWRGQKVKLIDTGGIDIDRVSEIERQIVKQVNLAVKNADLIMLVTDGQVDPLPQDQEAARLVKGLNIPSLLVINKVDNLQKEEAVSPLYYKLGLDKTLCVSARNGRGTGDLLDEIFYRLSPKTDFLKKLPEAINLALIGKPNVGKSSILNSLVGEERSIVTPIPYTTRETHDITIYHNNIPICLIDTAGLRKSSKIKKAPKRNALEIESERKTHQAIKKCHVALLILDLSQPITQQDKRLAQSIIEAKKGIVILGNKSDLLPVTKRAEDKQLINELYQILPFLTWAPILVVSAKTYKNIQKIIPTALEVNQNRNRQIEQAELTHFIRSLVVHQRPPLSTSQKNKRVELFIKQIGIYPPTFELTANLPGDLPKFYFRYIENKLREKYNLIGTPISIIFKKYFGKT